MSIANKLKLFTDGEVIEIGDNLVAVGTASSGYYIYNGNERYAEKFSDCTKWGNAYILKKHGISVHDIAYSVIDDKGNFRDNIDTTDLAWKFTKLYNQKVRKIFGSRIGYTNKLGSFYIASIMTDYITYTCIYNQKGKKIVDVSPIKLVSYCKKSDKLVLDVSKLGKLKKMLFNMGMVDNTIKVDIDFMNKSYMYKSVCIDNKGKIVKGHSTTEISNCQEQCNL